MGPRYLAFAIPGVIVGLVLHGIWWLLGKLPFISYGGLFSESGLMVWIGSVYLVFLIVEVTENGWRRTFISGVQWSIIVGAIYAVALSVSWYFGSHPDTPLVSWLRDTGRNLVIYWDKDLANGWKVAIAIFAFIAFFTLVPLTFYIVWSFVKGIFKKVYPNNPS